MRRKPRGILNCKKCNKEFIPTGKNHKNCTKKCAEVPVIDRFLNKTKIIGDCLVWTGARDTSGYGNFRYLRKTIKANRMSFVLFRDEIPYGLMVLHKCDNPPCVNPDHLFLGTHKDNYDDMVKKGREVRSGVKGSKSHFAKLNDKKVIEIRALIKKGVTQDKISKKYGVSRAHIGNIALRKSWVHI